MHNKKENNIIIIVFISIIALLFLGIGFFIGKSSVSNCRDSNHKQIEKRISELKAENKALSSDTESVSKEKTDNEETPEDKSKEDNTNISSYKGYPGGYFKLVDGVYENSFENSYYMDTGIVMTEMFPKANITTYEVDPDKNGLIGISQIDENVHYEIYVVCNPFDERYYFEAARLGDRYSENPEEVRDILNMITEISRN